MRLIDADALKEKILKERDAIPKTCTERYGFGVEFPNKHGNSMRGGIRKALRCMEQCPTVDAVPVVRCKDCRKLRGNGTCNVIEMICNPNDFCSYGERKEGDPE